MRHIHFIGIGGIGMSGIAQVLLEKGFSVSGSDVKKSHITARLERRGACIHEGHREENLGAADTVVISSAIPEDNPELSAARKRNLSVLQRAQMLGLIMEGYKGIAVAGTHGKTTVTSMISSVLRHSGLDPTAIIGGELSELSSNASTGRDAYLVAEADESDASFLYLSPQMAVITNIDSDVNLNVMPYAACKYDYAKTMDTIMGVFREFTHRVAPAGKIVLCSDSGYVRKVLPSIERSCITYGISHEADLQAENIILSDFCSVSDVLLKGNRLGRLELKVPGRHNVQNALAAIAVCMELGLEFKEIASALFYFGGLKRRFEVLGEKEGIMVVDDYAHNPSKLRAALHAAKTGKGGRLVAVFQPHRYSRTKFLLEELSESFYEADIVLVDEIYSAGETSIPGITAALLSRLIREKSPHVDVLHFQEQQHMVKWLHGHTRAGDVVITLGAGDITGVGRKFFENISKEAPVRETDSLTLPFFASPVE